MAKILELLDILYFQYFSENQAYTPIPIILIQLGIKQNNYTLHGIHGRAVPVHWMDTPG